MRGSKILVPTAKRLNNMPKVNGKRFSYTTKGKAKAAAYRKKIDTKRRKLKESRRMVVTEDAKPTSKYKHPKGARYK